MVLESAAGVTDELEKCPAKDIRVNIALTPDFLQLAIDDAVL